MKNLIKKILKEEQEDFQWVKDLNDIEPLRYTERHIYYTSYQNLQRFINKVYNKNINIPSMLESNNDTTHEFDTELSEEYYTNEEIKTMIDRWTKGDGEGFVDQDGRWYDEEPSLHEILYDLAHIKKIIPSGDWMVRVSW